MAGKTWWWIPGSLLLWMASAGPLEAVQQPESPVFKNYKPPDRLPQLNQSDPVYQIWQTFLVARRAAGGDVLAQHELGLRYLMGVGVDPDTAKAAMWIQKAADQNLTDARFNLGILYYHGWGVPWNPFMAYKDFLYCAEQNMVEAQYVLTQFLTENLVVAQNWLAACAWMKKAADAGYKPAQEALPELEKRAQSVQTPSTSRKGDRPPGSPALPVFLDFGKDTVARAEGRALLENVLQGSDPELKASLGLSRLLEKAEIDSATLNDVKKAADVGSPEALSVLGRLHEKGEEVHRDVISAAAYYVRAIRMDSPRAGELLWAMIQHKDFFPLLKLRAGQEDSEAEYAWAGLLALGFGGIMLQGQAFITEAQGLNMLKKASGRGHLPSMIELGLCYYAGRWVAQDQDAGVDLWRKAARAGSREAEIRIAVTTVRGERRDTLEDKHALEILQKAVQGGSVLAEMALGYCYDNGVGVPRITAVADRFYRAAARRGSQDAFRALKLLYDRIRPEGEEFVIL